MISCHLVHLLSWMNKRWDDLLPFYGNFFCGSSFFVATLFYHIILTPFHPKVQGYTSVAALSSRDHSHLLLLGALASCWLAANFWSQGSKLLPKFAKTS